jgi:phosphoglycolate phosphatase-like HAD superfamily hydrolase
MLILWDIDGTLILGGAIAGEAFRIAVERVLGREIAEHGVQMSGKTDPLIAAEILRVVEADPALAEEVVVELEAELGGAEEALRDGGVVLPGVVDVLARLDAVEGVVQSVLTGNTAANAAVKLRAFGIDRFINVEVGAFGSDHPERNRLVPIALARARARLARSFGPDEVWVVGDTPHDLACAQAGGVRCLLVGTGRIPMEDLEGIGADAVLPDLSDVDAVVRLLVGR